MVRDEWVFNVRLAAWYHDVTRRLLDADGVTTYSDWLRRRLMEHALALAYAEGDFSVLGDAGGVDLELVREVLSGAVWVVLAGVSYGGDVSVFEREERRRFVLDLFGWLVAQRGELERDQLVRLKEIVGDDKFLVGV